ncbi:MAG: hypothetical protein M1829_000413 [Trizodia sp. TS-e1964]|nr:MAG: hypothetical protein M1829_000413 [Trizodia sp. TS-e1964]
MVGKQVGDSADFLALQTFNIANDTGILLRQNCRVRLSAMYKILAFTGCWPVVTVTRLICATNEPKSDKDRHRLEKG